jgi:hypothetical protein
MLLNTEKIIIRTTTTTAVIYLINLASNKHKNSIKINKSIVFYKDFHAISIHILTAK